MNTGQNCHSGKHSLRLPSQAGFFGVFVCVAVQLGVSDIIPGQPLAHFGMQIASCHTWSYGTNWWCHGEANVVGERVRRSARRLNMSIFLLFPQHSCVTPKRIKCNLKMNGALTCGYRSAHLSVRCDIPHELKEKRKKRKDAAVQDDKTWYDSVNCPGWRSRGGNRRHGNRGKHKCCFYLSIYATWRSASMSL